MMTVYDKDHNIRFFNEAELKPVSQVTGRWKRTTYYKDAEGNMYYKTYYLILFPDGGMEVFSPLDKWK